MEWIKKLLELYESGEGAALCTIIETSGSTPRKAGSKMIVTADGKNFGSVGGGLLEKHVIRDATACIISGRAGLKSYSSGNDTADRVYGEASVFIDPLPLQHPLYIFGAGHVAQAVASLAVKYGFKVIMADPRKGLLDKIHIDNVSKIGKEYLDALEELEFTSNTFAIVMTHSHETDEAVTFACASRPHSYLGMIGSKKKVEEAKYAFLQKGMDEASIEKIDMPIGIPINCETPEEIAISILARLIDIKNKKD